MPSLVTDYIKDNWKHFSEKDKSLFIRDTERALNDHYKNDLPIGDDCDIATYERFLDWIKDQDATKTP